MWSKSRRHHTHTQDIRESGAMGKFRTWEHSFPNQESTFPTVSWTRSLRERRGQHTVNAHSTEYVSGHQGGQERTVYTRVMKTSCLHVGELRKWPQVGSEVPGQLQDGTQPCGFLSDSGGQRRARTLAVLLPLRSSGQIPLWAIDVPLPWILLLGDPERPLPLQWLQAALSCLG